MTRNLALRVDKLCILFPEIVITLERSKANFLTPFFSLSIGQHLRTSAQNHKISQETRKAVNNIKETYEIPTELRCYCLPLRTAKAPRKYCLENAAGQISHPVLATSPAQVEPLSLYSANRISLILIEFF